MNSRQLAHEWKTRLIGQDHVVDTIAPYISRFFAGMNYPDRPVGNFFLLGPTGSGKTKTVETLAELLHGNEKTLIRIDCGEYHADHEVAKLIGAPPGYLGHRETQPQLTQQKLLSVTSEKCALSIVLFDEVEKAAPSLWRLLLGILDKAILRLGDNQIVNFEKTAIMMTSNLGAQEMANILSPRFGFTLGAPLSESFTQLHKAGTLAISKKFPPEFPNRIDEIITYHPLTPVMLTDITKLELNKIQVLITTRLGAQAFTLEYGQDVVDFITSKGSSTQYGARELKRTLTRLLYNRLSDAYLEGEIRPGSRVICSVTDSGIVWEVEEMDLEDYPAPSVADVLTFAADADDFGQSVAYNSDKQSDSDNTEDANDPPSLILA
jgi:ATP-dependent Clp protease ATP-binding subunit ClpA